ncbi:MAG: GntR family transcriptional regulator [Lachnospiraceae bacterium]|nr:GntR family transcriptional regulator [Lachnospiraceae bacterium]MBR3770060.1 GntR family transcriptional regulator [Lachnospiraceae bacterium]
MIIIDYKDTRPIYEQIVEKMQTLILKGVLPNDSKLPSVRNLAIELSINPNTIQKAYAELERRGFLYTVKGRGNFVHYQDVLLDEKKAQLVDKIKQIIKEAEELGIKKEELFMAVDER